MRSFGRTRRTTSSRSGSGTPSTFSLRSTPSFRVSTVRSRGMTRCRREPLTWDDATYFARVARHTRDRARYSGVSVQSALHVDSSERRHAAARTLPGGHVQFQAPIRTASRRSSSSPTLRGPSRAAGRGSSARRGDRSWSPASLDGPVGRGSSARPGDRRRDAWPGRWACRDSSADAGRSSLSRSRCLLRWWTASCALHLIVARGSRGRTRW